MKPQQQNLTITPDMLAKGETVLCSCGNMCWEQLTVMKKISGFLAGTGTTPVTANIQVMRCSDCKEIYPEHLAAVMPAPTKEN